MKYAVMADIHANLEALRAALGDAKGQGCTKFAFVGDFVGYGPDPKACIDVVRAMNAPCVKGNFDEYCDDCPLDGFNPTAVKAIQWTRGQLTEEDRQWLQNLEYVRTVEGFTIVHATLAEPARWQYVFDKISAAESFNHQKSQVCFFGHTHVPVAFIRDSHLRGGSYSKFKIESGKKYFVNGGSVGQPRDNNPDAAYVIYDLDKGMIELRRVPYDFTETQRKIRETGLQ